MTCRPLTKEEADDLREKYWPKVIDALNREPGESLLEWEARAKSVRESLRAAQETPAAPETSDECEHKWVADPLRPFVRDCAYCGMSRVLNRGQQV